MSIITLTSDYGYKDYYVAAIKAKIITRIPDVNIIDVSHNISAYNVKEGAFVLKNVFHHFPPGTVHVFSVNEGGHSRDNEFFIVKIKEQFVIGTGKGFITAMGQKPDLIIKLDAEMGTFPTLDVFIDRAIAIIQGTNPEELGTSLDLMGFQTDLHLQQNMIIGAIVYCDNFGNLVTNIHRDDFERTRNSRPFNINFGREHVNQISPNYLNVPPSESACLFNSAGYLEIIVSVGNARRLLGLNVGSQVKIDFKDELF